MTEEDLVKLRQAYIKAELAVLEGKSITLNGQTLTMADLNEIRAGRREVDNQLKARHQPRQLFSRARLT